eukprot:TRINITY_DN3781_c0_g1_i4.p1 TRINITY_DN3781_c0_g1~~TRINITY_DN3781_c0_g1_i4.p1  ORF type:complete len:221 (+),score=42.09 TRINITY_DN3781_c0_g1_i4:181-843(+)
MSMSEEVLTVCNLTDGILAEAGFTSWNPVPNTSSFRNPPPMTNPAKFEQQVRFVRNLQKHGKGFFAINEWGSGNDYGLNPSKFPFNVSGEQNRAIRQFITAAYMMTNGQSSAIFLSCIQCYGGSSGGLGNFSLWPEYAAPVGYPLGEPLKQPSSGVWTRSYSGGLAIVNPGKEQQHVVLPKGSWADVYGQPVSGPQVTLPAASGLIVLRTGASLSPTRVG